MFSKEVSLWSDTATTLYLNFKKEGCYLARRPLKSNLNWGILLVCFKYCLILAFYHLKVD